MKFCRSYSKSHLFFEFLSLTIIFFISVQFVFAELPKIIDLKLNGKAENVTFNPSNDESVSISIKADKPVKFTRLYICSVAQSCTGSSGNYTRYFTQSAISDSISKVWNGKISGDAGFAPSGEYKIMVSMTEEGASTPTTDFGQFSIFLDFTTKSSGTTSEADNSNSEEGEGSRNISVHSSVEDISDYKDNSGHLKVSAGRERLTYVGFPVEFRIESNINSSQTLDCNWSFGDGFSQVGRNVFHTYKNAGEYILVLNAKD